MEESQRPNPDELLRQVTKQEESLRRGKLKIFFGAAAGVGKTYAMLEEAQQRAIDGVRVLVGYAEPHIRPETEALLLGLDILPYQLVKYRETTLKEFDLDAALRKAPELILVDELAHTNAPGMRHAKRWQDVAELLAAGINVYTTLNVQHLESVNDVVERATGIKVQETLPDSVFQSADEVQLVDLPPEKLIERLQEGKIYAPDRAAAALRHFFSIGNLLALRELALRRTADRINQDIDTLRQDNVTGRAAAVSERILVCVGPSPFSANLVRTAARMAAAWKAPWMAVYVETAKSLGLSESDRQRVAQTLNLAEQLGGEAVTLSGLHSEEEIIAYAKTRHVARIIVGKPADHGWRRWFRRSFVDRLIVRSGDIHLELIREAADRQAALQISKKKTWDRRGITWAIAVVAFNTALGIFLYHHLGLSDINVIMFYLLGVIWISARHSRFAGILTAVLSVAAFDFTVVKPYYSFAVSDTQYLLTFAAMLVTGVYISTLTTRLRDQQRLSRAHEQRTISLLRLSRDLILCPDQKALLHVSMDHITEFFSSPAGVILPDTEDRPALTYGSPELTLDEKELGVADWVIRHDEKAGAGTFTLPSAKAIYLPLKGVKSTLGALCVVPSDPTQFTYPDDLSTLEAFTAQIAVALERMMLSEESHRAWERTRLEVLRNTLLSAVSHDLRTPLAAITGCAGSLLQTGSSMSAETRDELLTIISHESQRLEGLIEKLLEMTRLESSNPVIHKEPVELREVIVSAVERWRNNDQHRAFQVVIPESLPAVSGDPVLIEQVLFNLIENALTHAPVQTPIEINAMARIDSVLIRVMDRGPGLPVHDTQRIFEKFFRGSSSTSQHGLGLGLAICKAIIQLHHGTITARNRDGGGAEFQITIPIADGK
ncbi:MAG: sensor histidine kinase KdpD [Planctomycetes bacterium]|nr:sensor histidine kinase KdpD [Planctomycetota bacterium]